MKWWVIGVVFLAVVVALLLTGGAASQGQCDTADALSKAKLYDKAQENYTDLLMINSTLDCAKKGLQALQNEQVNDLYTLGQAYENANQMDDARKAYTDALKIDPNNGTVNNALLQANGGNLTLDYTSTYTRLSPIGETIAIIVISILVIYALLLRIIPWIISSCKPMLNIQDFDKGATGLEIGKELPAMVEEAIKWFEKASHTYQSFTVVNGPIGKLDIPVDIKSVSSEVNIISQLIEWLIPPNVITLSGYLEKQGDRGVGLTLSMVSQTGEVIASRNFWQKEYDPAMIMAAAKNDDPRPYYHLVEPIATWTIFNLNNPLVIKNGRLCKLYYSIKSLIIQIKKNIYLIIIRIYILLCSFQRIKKKIYLVNKVPKALNKQVISYEKYTSGQADDFKILKTRDWQSFAYFRSGVHWEELNKTDIAQKMYLMALKEDPDNAGALLNLGILYTKDEEYKQALKIMKYVVNELSEPKNSEDSFIWYIGMYWLAGTYYYMAKQYRKHMFEACEKIRGVNENIQFSIKEIQNRAKMKCYLYMAGEDADNLVYEINKAIKAIQENEEDELESFLKRAKNIRETIEEFRKNAARISKGELTNAYKNAYELSKTIKDFIDKMENSNSAFNSKMCNAKKEAETLVETIHKQTGKLPDAEEPTKKLVKTITKDIDKLQDNKNKSRYDDEVREQVKQVKNRIENIDKLQDNEDRLLKCYLDDAKKLISTIDSVLAEKDILAEDKLEKEKNAAEELEKTIQLAVNELEESKNMALVRFLKSFELWATSALIGIRADMGEAVEEELSKYVKSQKSSEYHPQFQYNMACYYSIMGEREEDKTKRNKKYDTALLHLRNALEQKSKSAQWAKKDPTLKGVRDGEKKNEFNEIIEKYKTQESVQADSLPLAGLVIIGEAYASLLKEQGIVSHCDLILKAGSPEAGDELSKKLGISTQLLSRWVLLAGLMRIVGDARYASLLDEAGVESLDALKSSDPCELADSLSQINKAMSLAPNTPSIEIVQQWIKDAKKTKPKVL